MKNKFPIAEIFDSIDGEGKRTGLMAVFVRFAGCDLRCSYCDTAYALREEDAAYALTEEELLARVRSYPWKRVTFTGGEPLLRPIRGLCEALGREGYECNIETNGAAPLFRERPAGTFYTMDWKCPDSGMEERMREENFSLLTAEDVVKFVVGSLRDLAAAERVVRRHCMGPGAPRAYFSPVFGKISPRDIVEFVRREKLADVAVQVQLHKIIWPPDMRGV